MTLGTPKRILVALLLVFTPFSATAEENGDQAPSLHGFETVSPLPQDQLFTAMRATAARNGLRLNEQTPTPCGPFANDTNNVSFCEYVVFRIRVGFWSPKDRGPVSMISARPLFYSTKADLVMAISLIIATVDENLSQDEIQSIAVRLVTANLSLGGKTAIAGEKGFYMAKASGKGFTFLATKAP